MIEIFLLMILAHVVDDFVLQPVCLSKLKQKSWWETQDGYKTLYNNDYKMALLVHSMSWSIMILLPVIITNNIPGIVLFSTFIVNTLIHYYIDDMKANKGKINLMVDQFVHIMQIITTWIAICQWI
jgi:hypothetical protein